jgi:SRSO17 transposase
MAQSRVDYRRNPPDQRRGKARQAIDSTLSKIVFHSLRGRSAGVQRPYTGTAGKITNCQIGLSCSYANPDKQRC